VALRRNFSEIKNQKSLSKKYQRADILAQLALKDGQSVKKQQK